jgi:S-formylglutathione hydrolase FrmB
MTVSIALLTFLTAGAAMAETPSPTTAPALDPAARVSSAQKDASGVLVHAVESPFQAGTTKLRVLLPDRLEPARRYRVMYVLPVEAGEGKQFGDGLAEVRKLGLHNTHQLICVAPTFSHLPWYADHPTDPHIRQETYFLRVVVPAVEAHYPATPERAGRLLLGFSKSGWGAWSLLLRHPDVFAKAVAWDAPMMLDRPGFYGSGGIFATQATFDRYLIPALLAALPGGALGEDDRLALLGYGNFRKEHQALHDKLLSLKIPHRYADGPKRKHDWSSGWIEEAVAFLVGP